MQDALVDGAEQLCVLFAVCFFDFAQHPHSCWLARKAVPKGKILEDYTSQAVCLAVAPVKSPNIVSVLDKLHKV